MYQPQQRDFHHALELETKVESSDLGIGFHAYRLSQGLAGSAELPAHLSGLVKPRVIEGICTAQALEAFLEGHVHEIAAERALLVATPEFLRSAQHDGFSQALEKLTADGKSYAGMRREVYTLLVEQDEPLDLLVRAEMSSHQLFRWDGSILPVAVYCDYIGAGFHNRKYDLTRLVEALEDDPRVHFISAKGQGEAPQVHAIPGYNSDGGRTHYVQFRYSPTSEEAQALWATMLAYGTAYPSTTMHRAMFDLDVLGLRAKGIAKCADFYASEGDDEPDVLQD